MKYIYSPTKQKILLLLFSGLALGFTHSPRGQMGILKNMPKAWREIDDMVLRRITREFYRERLVEFREEKDGTIKLILSKRGEKMAMKYHIDEIAIDKPAKWDGKWRVVVFDIPEKRKRAREALREKLKELGFKRLQKSVLIHPFDCKDIIDFIVEFFEIRRHVRYMVVDDFTNKEEMELHFRRKNLL